MKTRSNISSDVSQQRHLSSSKNQLNFYTHRNLNAILKRISVNYFEKFNFCFKEEV